MNRRALIALIAVGALVAVVLNIRFWTSGPAAPVAGEEDWESGGEDENSALPALGWDEVNAYLRSLPEPGDDRSPFYTPEETLRLVSAPLTTNVGGPAESLRLDGTLTGPSRRVAWLDGRPQVEGDPVADFRLLGIEAGTVVLVRGEETLRLELSRGGAPVAAENEEQIDAQ